MEELVEVREERYPLSEVSLKSWIISLLILNTAFLLPEFFQDSVTIFGIFLIGPVVSLFVLGNHAFRKLFKLPSKRDIVSVVGRTLLLMIVAFLVGLLLDRFGAVDNPIVEFANEENFKFIVLLLTGQLVIEEIFFIIWFLFLYHNLKFKTEDVRMWSAWIISSLLFGAIHLSTYDFNIVQSIFGIGIIRFFLSEIYVRKKNLTLSYMVHLLYDLIIISSVMTVTP